MSLATAGSLSVRSEEYLRSRKAQGYKPGTIRNDVRTLRNFTDINGNILLKNVDDSHVIKYLEVAGQSRSQDSLVIDHAVLNGFFKWARNTRRMPANSNPMAGIKAPKGTKKERRRVPVTQFPRLLDAVPHPRDRMIVALGLYLFLRAGEIKILRVGVVNLENAEILVTVPKSGLQDLMPICAELDEELRRWLTFYTSECGPLRPDWYLVPAKSGARYKQDPTTKRFTSEVLKRDGLRPTKAHGQSERVAHRALMGINFLTESDDRNVPRGEGEGIHTLRRSGARGLFDAFQSMDDGPRYPIRQVQSMLHHADQVMTERYLGLEPDRFERDRLLKGRVMYRINRDNVVNFGVAGEMSRDHGERGRLRDAATGGGVQEWRSS